MKTGMIIVNYNDYESTKNLIENIKKYQSIEKIVVVDNNSKEEEKEKLKNIKCRKLKILFQEENKGYACAINAGAKYLIGEFGKCNIIVSNADIVISEEKHIKELLKTLFPKDVAVCAPVVLEGNHLNRGWKIPTPKQEILTSIPKLYKKMEKKYRYYKEEHYQEKESVVEVVSGCFFLIKSPVLEEISFFDENTFLYYEENILAKKLQKLGLKTVINNEVVVIHHHAVSIDRNINQLKKLKILRESQLYFEEKYNEASAGEIRLLRLINAITRGTLKISLKLKNDKKERKSKKDATKKM